MRRLCLAVGCIVLVVASPARAQSPFSKADPVAATEGTQFSGELAQFDTASVQCPKATIDWGDGTPASDGTIQASAVYGYSAITGTHTFAAPGTFTVTITLSSTCSNAQPATEPTTATVADAAKHVDAPAAVYLSQNQGETVTVGGFTDDDPTATPADYASATVTPGDGRGPIPATIVQSGSHFAVQVFLAYGGVGQFNGSWSVVEVGGSDPTQTFTVQVASTTPTVPGNPGGTNPTVQHPVVVTGADQGNAPRVGVFDQDGSFASSYYAFDPSFNGGVRVAVGDVNGDGLPDVVAGAGPGGGPHVKVFSGGSNTVLDSFLAFDPSFHGGVFVAAGDVNGDGHADIVVGAGDGGAQVKVFSGVDGSVLQSFLPYEASFTGGVHVATADVDGDGKADVVTGPGHGPAHVKVFSGATGATLLSFFAEDPAFTGGVFVAAGDVNGDGKADVVTGAGGGGAHVNVFSGATGAKLDTLVPFSAGVTDELRVAAGDVNGDGHADLVTGRPGGGAKRVKLFDGLTFGELPFPDASPKEGYVAAGAGPKSLGVFPVRKTGVLAFAAHGTLWAYNADGSPLFRIANAAPRGVPMRPIVGDWDGDGHDTVGLLAGGRVRLYDDQGHVTRTVTARGGATVATGDVNGDGVSDLAVFAPLTGVLSAYDLFARHTTSLHPPSFKTRRTTVLVDLFQGDADGKPELALVQGNRIGTVQVTLGDGSVRTTAGPFRARSFSIASIPSADGHEDLALLTPTRLYVIDKTGRVRGNVALPAGLRGGSIAGAGGDGSFLLGPINGAVHHAAYTGRTVVDQGVLPLQGANRPPNGAQFAASAGS